MKRLAGRVIPEFYGRLAWAYDPGVWLISGGLWKVVKRRSERDGKAIRWVVDDALDAELMPLIETLRQLGLRGEVANDKLVRLPMDDNVRGRILFGRRQTGLPAVLLLKLCLMRHVAKEQGQGLQSVR